MAAAGRQRGNPGTHRPERRVPLAALGGRARCHRFSDVRTARPAWLSGRTYNAAPTSRFTGGKAMTLSLAHLQPLVALIAGVLILLVPRILNYIVAIYLIV